MNEVLPQLNELLFSSVEGVLVESVEVLDTVVRVEARTTAGWAACPGCGYWSGRMHGSDRRFPGNCELSCSRNLVVLRTPEPEAATVAASRLCMIDRRTFIGTDRPLLGSRRGVVGSGAIRFGGGAGAVSAAGEALGIEFEDELVLVALGGVQLPVHR